MQHAVAAIHERRCSSTASQQSFDQHAQCRRLRPDAARGRAQSSGERAHLVVVYTSEHLRVITVNQLCRPSRLFSRMVSTRHRLTNVCAQIRVTERAVNTAGERPKFSKRRFAPVCTAVPRRTGTREFAAHLNITLPARPVCTQSSPCSRRTQDE